MVTAKQILWGSYREFSGPYFPGNVSITPPVNPSPLQKVALVTMATESGGGRPNAYNGYDKCKVTLGLPQFCEAVAEQASTFLGHLHTTVAGSMDGVIMFARQLGGDFRPVPGLGWRFVDQAGKPVVTDVQRNAFFLGGSSGKKNDWTDAQIAYAKTWAATFVNALAQPETFDAHLAYTAARLPRYVMDATSKVMLAPSKGQYADTGWLGAVQAMVVSFSANNSVWAHEHFQRFVRANPGLPVGSREFAVGLASALTFGPRIAIYPGRYNDIRPVIERLYGVDLPDLASQLPPFVPTASSPYDLSTIRGLQQALLALDYDLGPDGANGRVDKLTQAAVVAFQTDNKLTPDGIVGPRTRAKLQERLAALSLS